MLKTSSQDIIVIKIIIISIHTVNKQVISNIFYFSGPRTVRTPINKDYTRSSLSTLFNVVAIYLKRLAGYSRGSKFSRFLGKEKIAVY